MLVVVEPGRRSIETAQRIRQMSAAIGIRRFGLVLNKATQPVEHREWITAEFGPTLLKGVIPFEPRIASADRLGLSVLDLAADELVTPYRQLLEDLDLETKESAA